MGKQSIPDTEKINSVTGNSNVVGNQSGGNMTIQINNPANLSGPDRRPKKEAEKYLPGRCRNPCAKILLCQTLTN